MDKAQVKAFSWRERIAEVKASKGRRKFTKDDRIRAKEWMTCAVGEQHRQLPEVVVYSSQEKLQVRRGIAKIVPVLLPDDEALVHLGQDFYRAIIRNSTAQAEFLLDQIEDRTLQLKRGEDS